MSDLVYLALTLLSFAGLALLVGSLGSWLESPPDASDDRPRDSAGDAPRGAAEAVRR